MKSKEEIQAILLELDNFPREDSRRLLTCFLKLGDRRMIFRLGTALVIIGIPECEPSDWRKFYNKLVAMGLIEYSIRWVQGDGVQDSNPIAKGRVITTELGNEVRNWFYANGGYGCFDKVKKGKK